MSKQIIPSNDSSLEMLKNIGDLRKISDPSNFEWIIESEALKLRQSFSYL